MGHSLIFTVAPKPVHSAVVRVVAAHAGSVELSAPGDNFGL